MRTYVFLAGLTLAAATVATAAIIVQEDFEGSKFPPTGWETIQNQGIWTREYVGTPQRWVAYFHTFGMVGGNGQLRTTGHQLDAGRYRVSFMYSYRSEGGSGNTNAFARVQRKQGTGWILVAGYALPKNTSLRSYSFEYQAPSDATYRLFFRAYADAGSIVFLRLDDITWESGPFTGIAPASVGRVKALFY